MIEIMVAMTILSVVLMSLAQLALIVAVRGRGNDLVAKRNAALQLEANKFGAVSFASLSTWSTASKTLSLGNFSYTRNLTITQDSPSRYTVKVVVIPTSDATKKDSIILDRSLPSSATPLCVGC